MARRMLLCVLVAVLVVLAWPPPVAAGPPMPTYMPPVSAVVVDPFRPPAGPYGAGNRGLEYGTAPGTVVRAVADGTVTFAGWVAGSLHVTVRHPDGIRTSYSFLARIDVVVGLRVAQGDALGSTRDHLHLGARSGDSYFDPATLFGQGPPQVRLVPFDQPPGTGGGGERSAIRQLIAGIGDAGETVVGAAGATATWLREDGPQVARTALHYLSQAGPGRVQHLLRTAAHAVLVASAAARRPCTQADQPPGAPPSGRRVAVLVGGLGSSSERAAVDDIATATLGYDEPDVVRFSYAGGRIPDAADGFPFVPALHYGPADTQADLERSGARLADLIEALAADAPGVPLDLYAHSQGGLVARLAIIELERRHGVAGLDAFGMVATLGTPHGGADLATAVYAVGSSLAGGLALDGAGTVLGTGLDPDGRSVRQMAETSSVVRKLGESPVPEGVRAVSIAARGDLVVPVPGTAVAGAVSVVVPLVGLDAHDDLPGSSAAQRELALALAGMPPTCTSFGAALTDQLVGAGISWAEDGAGAGAWLGVLP